MISKVQDKVFTALKISKEALLTEMAWLMAKQQLSEYTMEVDSYEKKTIEHPMQH